tara:strand:- start:22863 stop:23120 length:258 start_codon:yes stop_codon:yes gene_type:complete
LPVLKVRGSLAAIKGDRTLAEHAEQFDVHQDQIQNWRKQLLDQADTVFGRRQDRKTADETHLKDEHAKLGELALENNFFDKKLGG